MVLALFNSESGDFFMRQNRYFHWLSGCISAGILLGGCVAGIDTAPAVSALVDASATVVLQNTITSPSANVSSLLKATAASGITCNRYSLDGTNIGSCTTSASGVCQMEVLCSVTDAILVCDNGMKSHDVVSSSCAQANIAKGLSKSVSLGKATVVDLGEVTIDNLFAVLMLENAIKKSDPTWNDWGEALKDAALTLDMEGAYLVGKEIAGDAPDASEGVSFQLGFIQAIVSGLIQANASATLITQVSSCSVDDAEWATISELASPFIDDSYNALATLAGYNAACQVFDAFNSMFATKFVSGGLADDTLDAIKDGSIDAAVLAKPLETFDNVTDFTNAVGGTAGFTTLMSIMRKGIESGDCTEFINNPGAFVGVLNSFAGDFSNVTDDIITASYFIGDTCTGATLAAKKECGIASARTLFTGSAADLDSFVDAADPGRAIEMVTGYWASQDGYDSDTAVDSLYTAALAQFKTAVGGAVVVADCVQRMKEESSSSFTACYDTFETMAQLGADDTPAPAPVAPPSNVADLSGIALSSGSLSPAFSEGRIAYTVSVTNDIASITLTPTASNSRATITVDGSTVISGAASQSIALDVDVAEAIRVIVTAEDTTTTKIYTVTVTREVALPTIESVLLDGVYTLPYSVSRLSGAWRSAVVEVTFNNEMDPATIPNISYTCNGDPVSYNAARSGDDTVWTLAPDADLLGYSPCAVSIGTDVGDVNDNFIAEEEMYTFTTLCSTNDLFGVDSLGFASNDATTGNCWIYNKGTGAGITSNALNFSVDTVNERLQYVSGTADHTSGKIHWIYKTYRLPASAFTATVALVGGDATNHNLNCGIRVVDSDRNPTYMVYYNVGYFGSECALSTGTVGAPTIQYVTCNANPSTSTPMYLQLSYNGSGSMQGLYRSGSTGDFTSINTSATTIASNSVVSVGVFCTSAQAFTQYLDMFTVTGATAASPGTQY